MSIFSALFTQKCNLLSSFIHAVQKCLAFRSLYTNRVIYIVIVCHESTQIRDLRATARGKILHFLHKSIEWCL